MKLRSLVSIAQVLGLVAMTVFSVGAIHLWRAAGPDGWNPPDAVTPPDLWRFYELPELATTAQRADEKDQAEALAMELLELAEKYPNNWNYGNAIHDGHAVLGMVALERNDLGLAKVHLLRAGGSPGSPQLDTFGPDMSLANALLEQGETDTVISYFQGCAKFWESDRGRLARWTAAVRKGESPQFGAHLP